MNPPVLIVLFVLAAAAVVALAVVLTRRGASRRRAGLEAVAQQSGWSYSSDTVEPEALGGPTFPLFTQGRARKASNIMRLPPGATAVTVFDYQYTVGSGQHQHTTAQTVVHVRSSRFRLPPFVLGPENLLHKIGGLLGYHDIDFDENPEFSKKYLLRSKEAEDSVRDLFTPAVRAYFDQRTPLTVEGQDDAVLVYGSGRRVKPEDVSSFVEDAQAVARQFER